MNLCVKTDVVGDGGSFKKKSRVRGASCQSKSTRLGSQPSNTCDHNRSHYPTFTIRLPFTV